MIRTVAILALLAVLAAAAYLLAPSFQSNPMLVQNAVARPVADVPEKLSVTFTLANPGGPDRLISARSESATVTIVRPDGATGTPIPAGSEPAFSTDGVYLTLSDFATPPREGDLIPIELALEQAGPLTFKARVETAAPAMAHGMMQGDGMAHGHTGHDAPAPKLTVQVTPDGEGWLVSLQTEHFTFFKPDGADMAPEKPGEGHAHLYLDGLKVGRMYAATQRIGALMPGTYRVSVGLNTNMHRPVLVHGKPLVAEHVFEVE